MNAEEFAKSIDRSWYDDDVTSARLFTIESAIEFILERLDKDATEQSS